MSMVRGPFLSALSRVYQLLPLPGQVRPIADAKDREFWGQMQGKARDRVLAEGEQALNTPLPTLTLAAYLGDEESYQRAYHTRRDFGAALVLAHCAGGEQRFLEGAASCLWAILEESTWVLPRAGQTAHPLSRKADGAALRTAALMALAAHLLPGLDQISPHIRPYMREAARERGLVPLRESLPVFMTNPAASPEAAEASLNGLLVTLLAEPSQARRGEDMEILFRVLDGYMLSQPLDGSCREGLSLWSRGPGAILDTALLLREVTRGGVNLLSDPQVRALGRYPLSAHLYGRMFAGFDKEGLDPPVRGDVVYRYGTLTQSQPLRALGAYLLDLPPEPPQHEIDTHLFRRCLGALFSPRQGGDAPLPLSTWLSVPQQLTARVSAGSAWGFVLAARAGKAGREADAGSFAVLYQGGVRLGHLPQVSSTPLIGEYGQIEGALAMDTSCHQQDEMSSLSMNLGPVYPKEAGLISWQRTLMLSAEAYPLVQIFDVFDLSTPRQITFRFVIKGRPRLLEGEHAASLGPVVLSWDNPLTAKAEPVSGDMHLLTLQTGQVMGGAYTFTLRAAEIGQ